MQLTLVFPTERKICPRRMREQAVSLLRSHLLDITRVSRRCRLCVQGEIKQE